MVVTSKADGGILCMSILPKAELSACCLAYIFSALGSLTGYYPPKLNSDRNGLYR